MDRYKKLTILHSNDLHGDFLAEQVDDKLVGGISRLSGYIGETRAIEPNTIYCIAGDMFRGSVIDSEYLGLSTIEVMNMLAPDVVTIGNHETDYGLAHLLFIEKCAQFPIINANLHINMNNQRLFRPYEILDVDGMKILFIGITTEEVISNTKSEGIISTFIDVNDAADEVGRICNAFNGIDIDFTVLLTHIGYEEDIKLAEKLDPAWGVDVIIGGHSHTFLDKPAEVNNVLIVQAGIGTDQIGRFDLIVDTDNNCVESYSWNTIAINDQNCPRDEKVEELIQELKRKTDLKYDKVLTRWDRAMVHPTRYDQTELGSIVADILRDSSGSNVCFMGNGTLRRKTMGPIVTLKDLMEVYPYKENIWLMKVTGKQLRHMIEHAYRKEAWDEDNHCEFYSLSKNIHVYYSKSQGKVVDVKYHADSIGDERMFTVTMAEYHYLNAESIFDINMDDIRKNQTPRIVITNAQQAIEEYLKNREKIKAPSMDRIIIVE